jgi:hypothetical protein
MNVFENLQSDEVLESVEIELIWIEEVNEESPESGMSEELEAALEEILNFF